MQLGLSKASIFQESSGLNGGEMLLLMLKPGRRNNQMIDLIRLKGYVSSRVQESGRLEKWAMENNHFELARAHRLSQVVGNQILTEIEEAERNKR
jgi:hypothetical protein